MMHAVRQVQEYLKQGYTVAADLDLARFFDSVNFDVLRRRVAAKVYDPRVLRLVWRYLRAGVMENRQWNPTEEGVPQGGPLSPLLANIMLDPLDKELMRFIRIVEKRDDSTGVGRVLLHLFDTTQTMEPFDPSVVDMKDEEQVGIYKTVRILRNEIIFADSYLKM